MLVGWLSLNYDTSLHYECESLGYWIWEFRTGKV